MKSKRKTVLVSVRIPPELNKRFGKLVAIKGMSKNAFILSLINREIDNAQNIIIREPDMNNRQKGTEHHACH